MFKNQRIVSILSAFLLILASFSECNAAALGNNVVALATNALEVTDGFTRPINGGDLKRAEELYKEYYDLYDKLQNFLQNPPNNTWNAECDCIAYVGSIVNFRRLVLLDYIIAVEAYQHKQMEQYNQMISIMYSDLNNANYMRQVFYNEYGF